MFDGAYLDHERTAGSTKAGYKTDRKETAEAEQRRLVQEWTESLSDLPGWRGGLLRIAFTNGWC